ncbi:unnamed protein product, partial [Mesorhabditis spiculigera]
MWLFRLEFLTAYMSDAVVNGFMFGAAVHSARSQIPALLGIKVPNRDSEFFMIIYQLIDICKKIPDVNLYVLGISAVSITFLVTCKMLTDKYWPFKKIPFPSELILLISATIFSYFVEIHKHWKVSIIEDIPTGFPPFTFPKLALFPALLSYGISIAVVAFAITVSMGKMFAKKHGYTIYPNQELLALGSLSVISSMFNVFPTSCSLSRTLVNEASGAKSQVSGVVSAGITLIVILFVGPLLESLPMCVLSSIVIVALRSLMMKVQEVPPLGRISKIDCAVWVITAAAVLGYDIVEGLVVGVVVAVLSVIARSQWPPLNEIGRLPSGDFRVANRYDSAAAPIVPVIRFDAPLIFTNVERFKRAIRHEIATLSRVYVTAPEKLPLPDENDVVKNESNVHWDVVILDCSTWVYTDSMGIEAVKELILEMLSKNTLVLFSEVRSFWRCIGWNYTDCHSLCRAIAGIVADVRIELDQVPPLGRISKIDCAVWVITAAAVLGYDIVEGLVVGVVVAVLSVIARSQWPPLNEIGRLPSGDFRVANRYDSAAAPIVPVIRFDAPLIFTNVERFKRAIRHEIATLSRVYSNVHWDVVILDCSTWVYTDSMGIEAVKELILEMLSKNTLVLFSEVRSAVLMQYRKAGLFEVASEDQFYPSTAHALEVAEVVLINGSKFIEAAGLGDKLRRCSLRSYD